jgi:predicted ATPase
MRSQRELEVEVSARFDNQVIARVAWEPTRAHSGTDFVTAGGVRVTRSELLDPVRTFTTAIREYSFDPVSLKASVMLAPGLDLGSSGLGLAGVLDRLRDEAPERFEALNAELGRWLPEFDRVLFVTPGQGLRALRLRSRSKSEAIDAAELSDGTLLALAILALAYQPTPPSLVAIEEPERGIHPRLLRRVQDALYRLSHPQAFGESRPPVQVVATTHSPYFLDLYRDRPEEIVIAHREGDDARFERLIDRPEAKQILEGAPLGEVWYSGILGGVPAGS